MLNQNDPALVVPGDLFEIDGELYLAAQPDKTTIAFFNLRTGKRWTEPADYCGCFPNGGTPVANLVVDDSVVPVWIRGGPSRNR